MTKKSKAIGLLDALDAQERRNHAARTTPGVPAAHPCEAFVMGAEYEFAQEMSEIRAQRIVNAVLMNLSDRGGVGDLLDAIRDDREVYTEMYADLVLAVKDAFENNATDPSRSFVYGG